MTLIAFFMLETVLMFGNGEIPPPFYQRVSFQMMILIVLALPTLSFYLSNETKKLLSEEFMHAARTLGGSKWHLIKRHLFPNLRPLFLIVFMQQFVQALILFLHLGILELFFGGTIVFSGGEVESVSSEWSGLIGLYFRSLSANPWIPLVPIGCFILTIIAGNTIVRRMKVAMEKQYEAKEKTDEQEKDEPVTITASSFTFYK
ncbi:ABC transporter permease subunit [Bacillus manliponensis]|uniref:ABC transporter permease subunit n=1 Tax=Bacillus manliponensis TaxID=574376 RepID=UPI00351312C8